MTYLASDENAAAYTVVSGYLPTTYSCVEAPALQAFLEENPFFRNAIDQMEFAHRRPLTKAWKNIYTTLTDELAYCMAYTDTDAAAAIAGVAEQAQTMLNE